VYEPGIFAAQHRRDALAQVLHGGVAFGWVGMNPYGSGCSVASPTTDLQDDPQCRPNTVEA
jgi:hypothetical protein